MDLINCVHVLAHQSTTELIFANRDGVIIPNEENDDNEAQDLNYEPGAEEEDDDHKYPESDNDDDGNNENNGAVNQNNAHAIDPDLHIARVYAGGYDYDWNNPNGDNINEPPQNQNDNNGPELKDMHRTEVTDKNGMLPVQEQNNIGMEPNSDKETFTEDIARNIMKKPVKLKKK